MRLTEYSATSWESGLVGKDGMVGLELYEIIGSDLDKIHSANAKLPG